MSLKTRIS